MSVNQIKLDDKKLYDCDNDLVSPRAHAAETRPATIKTRPDDVSDDNDDTNEEVEEETFCQSS